jgi:prepilin signal peptidase PulO-like enzyme (type II secretory pathway)
MITGGFIFVLGLVFGSFLNAWEYRIESKMSLRGRSICPKCKKQIAWYDNIPVLSWIILRGKCRHCQKPISIQYPAIELITGLLFLLLWLYSSPGIELSKYLNSIFNIPISNFQFPIVELFQFLLLTSYFLLLALVGLHDAKTKYVLTKYVYIAAAIGLAYNLLHFSKVPTLVEIYPYILAVFIPAAILWLMARLSNEKIMGYGDADIALAIGALLGWAKIIPSYYFAFITGSIYGLFVIIRRKGGLKSEVPLGPFLISGALFGLLYGQQIVDWYAKTVFGI